MRKGSDIKVAHVVHCSTEHPDTIGSQACFRWHLCLSALLGEAESVSCLATAVAPWAAMEKCVCHVKHQSESSSASSFPFEPPDVTLLTFNVFFHAEISLSAVASVQATSSFLLEGIRRSTIERLCHQK